MIANRNHSLKLFLAICNRTNVKILKQISQPYHTKKVNIVNKTLSHSYGNSFIYKRSISLSSINNKPNTTNTNKENDEDSDDYQLFLNDNDSDNEEETAIEIKKNSPNKVEPDNKPISNNKNNNNEKTNAFNPPPKKSIYDSNKIIMYEDVTELPSYMSIPLLTDREIEQINMGVSDFDLGDYVINVTHVKHK